GPVPARKPTSTPSNSYPSAPIRSPECRVRCTRLTQASPRLSNLKSPISCNFSTDKSYFLSDGCKSQDRASTKPKPFARMRAVFQPQGQLVKASASFEF